MLTDGVVAPKLSAAAVPRQATKLSAKSAALSDVLPPVLLRKAKMSTSLNWPSSLPSTHTSTRLLPAE